MIDFDLVTRHDRKVSPSSIHTELTLQCTLHTALNTRNFKLHTAHCTLHTTHYTLHTAHCKCQDDQLTLATIGHLHYTGLSVLEQYWIEWNTGTSLLLAYLCDTCWTQTCSTNVAPLSHSPQLGNSWIQVGPLLPSHSLPPAPLHPPSPSPLLSSPSISFPLLSSPFLSFHHLSSSVLSSPFLCSPGCSPLS